jgi:hypothetical protein
MWHVWKRGEVIQGFGGGDLIERDNLEHLAVDGTVILRWNFKKCGGGMDWIDLTLGRDRLRALVNVVMHFRVPYNAGKFLTS